MAGSIYDLLGGRHTTILADLGPLPEVVETDSDTAWQLFLKLQAHQPGTFAPTEPSSLQDVPRATGSLTVQEVMSEARRLNRVCPKDPKWQEMGHLLKAAAGAEPPSPILPPESRTTPPLVKRIRIRDQVEWCEQHGLLPLVYTFIKSLAEEEWVHIGS